MFAQDKVVTVEAIAGGESGVIRSIRGNAPFQLGDAANWFELIKEHLLVIGDLCQADDRDVSIIQSLIEHATEHPMALCDEGIRALRKSFPDDEDLKEYHYKGEEEEKQRKEEEQESKSLWNDPIRVAEGDRKNILMFLDNLKAAGFDVKRILEDQLAGTPKPIEEYKGNGKQTEEEIREHTAEVLAGIELE